jgi:ketosteroid isomerase-like protein
MKYQPFVVACCLAVGALPAHRAFASTADDLQAVEEQRRSAIKNKDFGILSAIYDSGFEAVAGNGQLINRAQLFEVFKASDPSLSFTTDEIHIVEHGDTAIFFGRLVASTASGKQAFASRFSHVFIRGAGKWVCVAGQSTPLAAPNPG